MQFCETSAVRSSVENLDTPPRSEHTPSPHNEEQLQLQQYNMYAQYWNYQNQAANFYYGSNYYPDLHRQLSTMEQQLTVQNYQAQNPRLFNDYVGHISNEPRAEPRDEPRGEPRDEPHNEPLGQTGLPQQPQIRLRRRTFFTAHQLSELERLFAINKYVSRTDRKKLSLNTGMTDIQIQVWFKNKRSKVRKAENVGTHRRSTKKWTNEDFRIHFKNEEIKKSVEANVFKGDAEGLNRWQIT